jgi:hypothetical protein
MNAPQAKFMRAKEGNVFHVEFLAKNAENCGYFYFYYYFI